MWPVVFTNLRMIIVISKDWAGWGLTSLADDATSLGYYYYSLLYDQYWNRCAKSNRMILRSQKSYFVVDCKKFEYPCECECFSLFTWPNTLPCILHDLTKAGCPLFLLSSQVLYWRKGPVPSVWKWRGGRKGLSSEDTGISSSHSSSVALASCKNYVEFKFSSKKCSN
jgi:hypothetical protein